MSRTRWSPLGLVWVGSLWLLWLWLRKTVGSGGIWDAKQRLTEMRKNIHLGDSSNTNGVSLSSPHPWATPRLPPFPIYDDARSGRCVISQSTQNGGEGTCKRHHLHIFFPPLALGWFVHHSCISQITRPANTISNFSAVTQTWVRTDLDVHEMLEQFGMTGKVGRGRWWLVAVQQLYGADSRCVNFFSGSAKVITRRDEIDADMMCLQTWVTSPKTKIMIKEIRTPQQERKTKPDYIRLNSALKTKQSQQTSEPGEIRMYASKPARKDSIESPWKWRISRVYIIRWSPWTKESM